MKGDHTLGREESRAGRFLNRRDYCKLHIIAHYVKALLGPDFQTTLIGKVGDDAAGRSVMDEMRSTGLDVRSVQVCPEEHTLFSVCFTYPDEMGGNLTAEDSASSRVSAEDIVGCEAEFARFAERGVALAAPEVPLEARRELLDLAARYGFFRAGSLVTVEIPEALRLGLLDRLDLLALNIDEAAALVEALDAALSGIDMEEKQPAAEEQPAAIVEAAVEKISKDYPRLALSLTAGKNGSWSWDGVNLIHRPAVPAPVASTAGAGDAHLAAMIAGRVAGLDLARAQELAGIVAALSVTSPHTIAPEVDRSGLWRFAQERGLAVDEGVRRLIQD